MPKHERNVLFGILKVIKLIFYQFIWSTYFESNAECSMSIAALGIRFVTTAYRQLAVLAHAVTLLKVIGNHWLLIIDQWSSLNAISGRWVLVFWRCCIRERPSKQIGKIAEKIKDHLLNYKSFISPLVLGLQYLRARTWSRKFIVKLYEV